MFSFKFSSASGGQTFCQPTTCRPGLLIKGKNKIIKIIINQILFKIEFLIFNSKFVSTVWITSLYVYFCFMFKNDYLQIIFNMLFQKTAEIGRLQKGILTSNLFFVSNTYVWRSYSQGLFSDKHLNQRLSALT